MIFRWESEKEKLLRFIKMSPKKKLEWLREMNQFLYKYTPKQSKAIRQKLRKV